MPVPTTSNRSTVLSPYRSSCWKSAIRHSSGLAWSYRSTSGIIRGVVRDRFPSFFLCSWTPWQLLQSGNIPYLSSSLCRSSSSIAWQHGQYKYRRVPCSGTHLQGSCSLSSYARWYVDKPTLRSRPSIFCVYIRTNVPRSSSLFTSSWNVVGLLSSDFCAILEMNRPKSSCWLPSCITWHDHCPYYPHTISLTVIIESWNISFSFLLASSGTPGIFWLLLKSGIPAATDIPAPSRCGTSSAHVLHCLAYSSLMLTTYQNDPFCIQDGRQHRLRIRVFRIKRTPDWHGFVTLAYFFVEVWTPLGIT